MQPQVPIDLAEAILVFGIGEVLPDSLLEVISDDRLVLEFVQVVLEERVKDLWKGAISFNRATENLLNKKKNFNIPGPPKTSSMYRKKVDPLI